MKAFAFNLFNPLFILLFILGMSCNLMLSAQVRAKGLYPNNYKKACSFIQENFYEQMLEVALEEDDGTQQQYIENISSTLLESSAVLHPDFINNPSDDGMFSFGNYVSVFLMHYEDKIDEIEIQTTDFKLLESLPYNGTLQLDIEYILQVMKGGKSLYRGQSVATIYFPDMTNYIDMRIKQIMTKTEYESLEKDDTKPIFEQRRPNQPLSKRTFAVGKGKNKVYFTMLPVKGGDFKLGDIPKRGYKNKTLTYNFLMGETEVTQELWEAVMGKGNNPSYFKGKKRPVEKVSWNDCMVFIKKLQILTGARFRLPTEAEWEYAARGGQRTNEYQYAGGDNPQQVGWSKTNSRGKTHEVAQLSPNELGLYDMSGNVHEWCLDWHAAYNDNIYQNPLGPSNGVNKVFRGGGYGNEEKDLQVWVRGFNRPSVSGNNLGFRLVLAL